MPAKEDPLRGLLSPGPSLDAATEEDDGEYVASEAEEGSLADSDDEGSSSASSSSDEDEAESGSGSDSEQSPEVDAQVVQAIEGAGGGPCGRLGRHAGQRARRRAPLQG